MNKIRFIMDGCDINFTAEAPADITLEQLLKQCNRVVPDYCACGIRSPDCDYEEQCTVDLSFDYNDVVKVDNDAPCTIKDMQ